MLVIVIIDTVLTLIGYMVFAYVAISWLISFGVLNIQNQAVWLVVQWIERLVLPLLKPIRRYIPTFSGLDLAPVILLLGIYCVQYFLYAYV